MSKKVITLEEIHALICHVIEHGASKEDLEELRAELKQDIAATRKEIHDLREETRENKKELKTEIRHIRQEVSVHKHEMLNHVDGFMRLHLKHEDEIAALRSA